MLAVVQATCPGCKNLLRIPADWLGQTFKCKHCGMVIQARTRPAANGTPAAAPAPPPAAKPVARPVAKPVAVPVAQPGPAAAAASSPDAPFSFDGAGAPAPAPRPRRRSGGGLRKGLVLAGAVLALAAAVTVFAWPYLSQMVTRPAAPVARNDDSGKREDSPPDERPAPGDTHKAVPPQETGKKPAPPRPDTGRRPDPSTGRDTGKKPPDLPVPAGPFPRRALAVSINNYLFANPINYGLPLPNARNVQTLLDRFTRREALRIPADQVAVLSDSAPDRVAVPPIEPVIRATIVNFLDTSRPQDRILLLIVGHVVEVGDEPALIPIDGDVESKEGIIPLKWIYERLAACKARQKVLVLDTCRLNPAKGQERPGSGPMGAKLDALLKEPPPGVQVWSACVAGQYSYEFEGGETHNGLFLEALYDVAFGVSDGKIQGPADALPLERLAEAVNTRMKKDLTPLGKVQTSRLAGSEAGGGAAPDSNEPAPPKPKAAPAPARPGGTADLTLVRAILKDISFPPLKVAKDQKPLSAEALPPFPAETLKNYMKDGEATPLRDEVRKARELLNDIAARHKLNDTYRVIAEDQLKAQVRRDQTEVARVIGDLLEQSDALKAVAEHRKGETKRWQATYDYVVARVEAQLAYLNEYQAVLGQILKGMAAPDPKLYNGWRLASQRDPQTGDRDARKLATESRKKLDKIIQAYPETPWAIMARRDRSSALGLEWQPTR